MQTILFPTIRQLGLCTLYDEFCHRSNHDDWEAFSDAIFPSNSCRPPADSSSDCVVLHRNRMRKAAIFIRILESRRRRNRLYLTRELLAPPGSGTVSVRLREAQDKQDDAFILAMGIDVHSFEYLLNNKFFKQWNRATIDRNDVNPSSGATSGRSRPERHSLDAAGTLALVLHHINSAMAGYTLQQIFGVTPAVCSRYKRVGLEILCTVLCGLPGSQVFWPGES